MPDLTCDPPISAPRRDEPFLQTLHLTEAGRTLALAHWHPTASAAEGVAQVVDLLVWPPFRRQGHAGRLLREIASQATAYFKARRARLRRLWIAVGQKDQVIARALLTSHGFHHVQTVKDVFRDQDLLIYTKAFD